MIHTIKPSFFQRMKDNMGNSIPDNPEVCIKRTLGNGMLICTWVDDPNTEVHLHETMLINF